MSVVRRRGAALAFAARVFCWPLAAVLLASSLLVRGVTALVVGIVCKGKPEAETAKRRLEAHARGARDYLAFRHDRFPPAWGQVPGPGEGRGPWMEAKRRLRTNRLAMASLIGIAIYLYVAMAAAVVVDADALAGDREKPYVAPSAEHPLGTDLGGRDVLVLTVAATRTAVVIGTIAGVVACGIGLLLGALAGFFGRWVDELVVWLYTTVESIPYVLLMLSFGFVFRSEGFSEWYEAGFLNEMGVSLGLFTIVLAVGLTFWVGVCRLVRGEFIKLRESDYVLAARALGVPPRRIIFRHVTPNVFHLVLISFSLLFMAAIKTEVILSFLGVGLDVGQEVSWGQMITQAKLELLRSDPVWWQITAATVAMFGLLLCVNLFTDALRDALDPRLRT